MPPSSSSLIVPKDNNTERKQVQKLNERMVNVQQRELLLSSIRQKHCAVKSTLFSFASSSSTPSLLSLSTNESDNVIQSEVKRSRDYFYNLNKITKTGSYGKRRKRAYFANQFFHRNMQVSYLDKEHNREQTVVLTAKSFKILMRQENPLIDRLIFSGAVPYFVQFLDQTERNFPVKTGPIQIPSSLLLQDEFRIRTLEDLHSSATSIIKSISSSGTSEHIRYLVEIDCLPKIINLMDSEDYELRNQSVVALRNLIDSTAHRDLAVKHGALSKIPEGVPRITGLLGQLVDCLDMNPSLQSQAIQAIGNIISLDDTENITTILLQRGLLKKLKKLVVHSKDKEIRKHALWTISNLFASSAEHFQMVLDSKIIYKVFSTLRTKSDDTKGKVEGYWVLSNVCEKGNVKQVKKLIKKGIIKLFGEGLREEESVKKVALGGLKHLLSLARTEECLLEIAKNELKEYGGLDNISNQITSDNM